MASSHAKNPLADYERCQNTLRGWLENRLHRSQRTSAPIFELSSLTKQLALEVASWSGLSRGLPSIATADPAGSRPAYCLSELNKAFRSADLQAAKTWSAELAAACFHLADLHRWLELLDANMLAALDFQAKCRGLFTGTAKHYEKETYDSGSSLGRYPGGSLILYGERNYYEIERQAENLFGFSRENPVSRTVATDLPAAYWMPPSLRESFRLLRDALAARHQPAWDRAASSPYERSCLENMLFRLSTSGALDAAATALRRMGRQRRQATSSDLLDVIFYRGGGFFCGLEWADRFEPRLMDATRRMTGDRQNLLASAYAFTNAKFDVKNYVGGTLTLRSALDTGAFDCIRATDMIGAIYRNAGGTGFCELRECRGGPSHTVAGIEMNAGNGYRVFSVDGLLANHRGTRTWPDSYFRSAREYCVEVYRRGLDTSLWAGGYIVCGPHAGTRIDAAIPYLPGREKGGAQLVYRGPYPREYTGSRQ